MSEEHPPYNQLYITAWTLLSIVVSVIILGMLIFGAPLLETGRWIWDLIRYLASPII